MSPFSGTVGVTEFTETSALREPVPLPAAGAFVAACVPEVTGAWGAFGAAWGAAGAAGAACGAAACAAGAGRPGARAARERARAEAVRRAQRRVGAEILPFRPGPGGA
ncbi:hypothetical protein GCM10009801_47760 [Streptomyces albiaxialis]|uniref:Uncharacterized protein n=1 Tax=Streptomyces albiaxialis TaxID=329523 RepID=A0ABP5HUX4_9ACTN